MLVFTTFQKGVVTDGDGPYIPGIDDCTWIIAPDGASTIYLTFSTLILGGAGGNDPETLELASCNDIACTSPIIILGSPYAQTSVKIPWYVLP